MYIVVLVTTKNARQAHKIANGLLRDKLVACVNIVAGVRSMFWWQGKVSSSKEALLVLKTKKTLFKKVAAKVKALHSYEVPEIIALPVAAGSSDYLRWISTSVN